GPDAVLGHRSKDHCFPGAGGQYQQGALVPGLPLGMNPPAGLGLVGPQMQGHQKAPFCQDSCSAAGVAAGVVTLARGAAGARNLTISLEVPVSPAWGPLRLTYSRWVTRQTPSAPSTRSHCIRIRSSAGLAR